jgi:hypothetical protein
MNKSAVLKATALGLAAAILVGVVAGAVGLAAGQTEPITDDLLAGRLAGPALVLTILNLLIYVATGAMYGWFAQQEHEDVPTSTGGYALGGGLAASLVGIVNGLVGVVLAANAGIAQQSPVGYAIGGVIGLALAFVIGGIPGAIGGALYGAAQDHERATSY